MLRKIAQLDVHWYKISSGVGVDVFFQNSLNRYKIRSEAVVVTFVIAKLYYYVNCLVKLRIREKFTDSRKVKAI